MGASARRTAEKKSARTPAKVTAAPANSIARAPMGPMRAAVIERAGQRRDEAAETHGGVHAAHDALGRDRLAQAHEVDVVHRPAGVGDDLRGDEEDHREPGDGRRAGGDQNADRAERQAEDHGTARAEPAA